jgi:hypothetical protein
MSQARVGVETETARESRGPLECQLLSCMVAEGEGLESKLLYLIAAEKPPLQFELILCGTRKGAGPRCRLKARLVAR